MTIQQYEHLDTPHQILGRHAADVFQRLDSSLTEQDGNIRRIYNLSIPHLAVLLLHTKERWLVIEDTAEHAERLCNDLQYLASACGMTQAGCYYFPPPANPEYIGERARIIHQLASDSTTSMVTSIEALHISFGAGGPFSLSKGLSVDRELVELMLSDFGYRKVNIVMEKGEYAERGWLFDIYPVTEDMPVRVELFGDEIDLIRTFDIETQRSIRKIKELTIYPAIESVIETENGSIDHEHSLIRFVNNNVYINSGLGIDDQDLSRLGRRPTKFSHLPVAGDGIDSGALPIAGLGILPEERRTAEDLADAPAFVNRKTVMVLPSTAQIERLKEVLAAKDIVAPVVENKVACSYEGIRCLTQGILSSGLHIPGLLLLTGREIFGEMPPYRTIRKSRVSRLLLTIDDLKPGDFVVHRDHGIGKFIGLQKEKIEDSEEDVITLEYAGGDRLYLPFQGIDKLRKYSAGEGHVPALDRIGGKRWQTAKQKVGKSVKEMAEKLLKLYAERKVSRGFIFSEDTPIHREFDDFFPYEETEDQIKAVDEIKKRMQTDEPMDMLICGDVGYGKTEVAVKAAFRAVYDGKQVAVLVPTTLLAEQHYRTFRARFAAFPVRIDYLSRFKDAKGVKQSMTALAKGETDIVIGTHMLLNKAVHFQDLGLLIIDEEHRFGVAQKERLKELRKGVDVITLTATPIPRTLHMSLSGIREMSTIETPPEERLAVRSVVTRRNDKTVREAIERELRREGQVFYVHNRIGDIEKVVEYVRKLVPDARIAYGHGQMAERQLERIMLAFLNRRIDVLVSTAIIGSGLDVPTANTIIIDRADTFGLSDLYQLRGRVGRGNVQAYSYFLIPGEDLLTDDAKKRLRAIQEMSYLGAGFRLAIKDLEIRGAGNLLGGEQSGHIYKVGFDMYMEMLERAVAELKGEQVAEEIEPQIRLRIAAFIPEDYIPDMALRLSMYKRLTAIKTVEELADFGAEMTDRFGKMPEEVTGLIHVIRVKILARRLFIGKVVNVDDRYRFTVGRDESGREYQVPEGFSERMLKLLLEMQKNAGKGKSVGLMQNGFELVTKNMMPEASANAVEEMLREMIVKM